MPGAFFNCYASFQYDAVSSDRAIKKVDVLQLGNAKEIIIRTCYDVATVSTEGKSLRNDHLCIEIFLKK